MSANNPKLSVDPGRPSKPALALYFMRSEGRMGLARLSRTLGFRRLHDAVPDHWKIPDSHFAQRAIESATTLCPEFMLSHCFRAYCFGAILAARNQLTLDRELLFVAAMLHDLGLCDKHKDDPGSFEWVGAKLAHRFCLDNEQTDARAAIVHNSIALHTSIGIVEAERPEVSLLHFGTGMDLFGMRLDEIPTDALNSVLADYPRTAFKAEFSPCLNHQAQTKPDSQIAGAVGIGILERILEQLNQG